MENNSENPQNTYPSWIKNLQENSFEFELFISGGAIFTLFQLSNLWLEWFETQRITFFLPGGALFLILGMLGIEVLKIGFITHLILRSFWISIVCINYAYPQGINEQEVKLKKPFKIHYEEKNLLSAIIKIDKLCGIVMFLSITSVFLLLGFMLILFLIVPIPDLLNIDLGHIEPILIVSLILYTFDFMTFGLVRIIPIINYLIYPIFKLFDFITLRFFFQKQLLIFLSNISKWKFVLSFIIYLSFAITLSYLNVHRIMKWPNILDNRDYCLQLTDYKFYVNQSYYKDEIPSDKINAVPFYIQSKIISESYLEVFIQYRVAYDRIIRLSEKNKKYFSDVIKLEIDDSTYTDIQWVANLNNSSNSGITAVIPINHLEDKMHILKIGCNNTIRSKTKGDIHLEESCNENVIPFWKISKR